VVLQTMAGAEAIDLAPVLLRELVAVSGRSIA
jgi:hypothetical protein